VLPLVGELAAVIDRRLAARRLDCAFIFHRGGDSIGDFRKVWKRACAAIGLPGRLVHDLRRSGVKHLIDSGNDPHTVTAFSGHRTPSMLRAITSSTSMTCAARPRERAPIGPSLLPA